MSKPWEDEPRELSFTHAQLRCELRRNGMDCWCGYVAVPEGHPLHGVGAGVESPALLLALEKRKGEPIGDSPGMGIMLALLGGGIKATPEICLRVHGGITWDANHCATGEPDGNWWFGFDCAHSGDLTPKYPHAGDVYRDMAYARAETESLADQIARLGT